MSYATGVLAILDVVENWITATGAFNTVIRGWKAMKEEVKDMPTVFIVLRRDRLSEQMGARAENRRITLEFWTLNNESHDRAIELAGAIIDRMEQDLTIDGNAAWTRFDDVEYYLNVTRGYALHWSKVVFELERRRQR